MTPKEKQLCRQLCAQYGEPPCFDVIAGPFSRCQTCLIADDFAADAVATERASCLNDCEAEARDDGTAQRIIARIKARGKP